MATPKETSAKEPLEEGGEKLKTEEAGKSTEEEGRRKEGEGEVDPLLEIQGSRWLEGGGSQSSSSDDDDYWDLHTWSWRRDTFAPRIDFGQESEPWDSLLIVRVLRDSLRRLSPDELRRFRRKLREIRLKKGFVRIPEEALHEADASRLGDLLLSYYGGPYAAKVAFDTLRAVGARHEADRLLFLAREGYYDTLSNERKRKL